MDNSENSLIIASTRALPTFELNVWAAEKKAKTLENAALIGKVTDRDSKIIAVRCQQELKGLINSFEKARVELKEPILIAGRKLDTLVATEKLPLEQELGRVSILVTEFDDAEHRRVREEEKLQRLELERIELEKLAELKRIADGLAAREAEARRIQEEANQKLRETTEVAAKLAAEATNKKQREAAESARKEALKQQALAEVERQKRETILKEQAAVAAVQAALIEEKSGDAAYATARPIEITKVKGQRTSYDLEIISLNEWVLAKGRPDLVSKITFDMRAVKEELKRGVKLPGVEAREIFKSDVRVRPESPAINV